LGYVFDDLPASGLSRRQWQAGGPKDRRLPAGRQGKRYCLNSICLELEKKEQK